MHLFKTFLMLERKSEHAFEPILPHILPVPNDLSYFPLTESQSRIYPIDISWGNPPGIAIAVMTVTFNLVFILPLGMHPWVKSLSLPNSNSWHRSWCFVHLASSLYMGSSQIPLAFINYVSPSSLLKLHGKLPKFHILKRKILTWSQCMWVFCIYIYF